MFEPNAMHRLLGVYILIVAALQLVLYIEATVWASSSSFYFDPRIGLFFFESMARRQQVYPGLLSWSSMFALVVAGVRVILNPGGIRGYLIVELVMAAPTMLMIVVVLVANLSPVHGFSIGELLVPVGVFVLVTVVPCSVALRIRKTLLHIPLEPTSGELEHL